MGGRVRRSVGGHAAACRRRRSLAAARRSARTSVFPASRWVSLGRSTARHRLPRRPPASSREGSSAS